MQGGSRDVARKIVGLDIGTTAVRAAELSVRRGRVVLDRLGQTGLPPGAVVDGEVADPPAVTAAIKALWRHARIGSKHVVIGVANQRVVVRLVDLPSSLDAGEMTDKGSINQRLVIRNRAAMIDKLYAAQPDGDVISAGIFAAASWRTPAASACCACCWPPPRRRCSPGT